LDGPRGCRHLAVEAQQKSRGVGHDGRAQVQDDGNRAPNSDHELFRRRADSHRALLVCYQVPSLFSPQLTVVGSRSGLTRAEDFWQPPVPVTVCGDRGRMQTTRACDGFTDGIVDRPRPVFAIAHRDRRRVIMSLRRLGFARARRVLRTGDVHTARRTPGGACAPLRTLTRTSLYRPGGRLELLRT